MNIPSKDVFKYEQRVSKIQACVISLNDLRQLFDILSEKTLDAIRSELESVDGLETLSAEERDTMKKGIKENMKLSFNLIGKKGGVTWSTDKEILSKENIPKDIKTLTYDSCIHYSLKTGRNPVNGFEVKIDFKEPVIFDLSVSPSEATHNESKITVFGKDRTWVLGVYQTLLDFCKERGKKRGWLHSKNTYDFVFLVLIVPICFYILYRLQQLFELILAESRGILYIGINIWFFFIILTLLRFLFNYLRWAFPSIEFIGPEGTIAKKRRKGLIWILLIFATILVEGLFKFVLPESFKEFLKMY